jgi:hypothetical protein
MLPDLKRETRDGWLVLGGTAVAVLVVVLYFWSQSGPTQVGPEVLQHARNATGKGQLMSARIAQQEAVTRDLRAAIERLKGQVGMQLASAFVVSPNSKDRGYAFKQQLNVVHDILDQKNKGREVPFNPDLGFTDEVPPPERVPYLMSTLELTEKVMLIALGTPSPLEDIVVSHSQDAVPVGPQSRATLLRQNQVQVVVSGGLKDVLWMLWSFSTIKPAQTIDGVKDYPLIVSGLSINSQNTTQRDHIYFISVTFKLAAMQFLTQTERDDSGTGHPGANTSGFQAHP